MDLRKIKYVYEPKQKSFLLSEIEKAIQVARMFGAPIGFDYNLTALIVTPESTFETVLRDYLAVVKIPDAPYGLTDAQQEEMFSLLTGLRAGIIRRRPRQDVFYH